MTKQRVRKQPVKRDTGVVEKEPTLELKYKTIDELAKAREIDPSINNEYIEVEDK